MAQLGAATTGCGAAQLSMAQPERSKTEGGSEGPGLALSAGTHSKLFPGEGRFGYVIVCCVLARCLAKEKMLFLCYGIFSAI